MMRNIPRDCDGDELDRELDSFDADYELALMKDQREALNRKLKKLCWVLAKEIISLGCLIYLAWFGFTQAKRATQCETDFYKLQLQKSNYDARNSAHGASND